MNQHSSLSCYFYLLYARPTTCSIYAYCSRLLSAMKFFILNENKLLKINCFLQRKLLFIFEILLRRKTRSTLRKYFVEKNKRLLRFFQTSRLCDDLVFNIYFWVSFLFASSTRERRDSFLPPPHLKNRSCVVHTNFSVLSLAL